VLADDNFATIERAVGEGRRIYDNLQKSVVFLLPTNGAQALVILVAVLLGLALPLDPVQILWVNMVSSITLSLALAYDPAEPDVMTRPPRSPRSALLERRYIPRVALVSVLIAAATLATFELARQWDWTTAQAQTMAVNTLVVGQVAYLFNSRHLRKSSLSPDLFTGNKIAWICVGVLTGLQLLFVYLPVLNTWFSSAPIGIVGWLIPGAFAVVIFLLVEAGKVALRGIEENRTISRSEGSSAEVAEGRTTAELAQRR